MRDLTATAPRWHLVLTKACGEELAKVNLERQGYSVYLPRVQQKTLKRGKWAERVTALFPRYLFVQLDASMQSLSPVRSTVGVASIVRFGIDYTVVPARVVSDLLQNEDPTTGLHTIRSPSVFNPGSAVLIARGALRGLEGVFESENASDRVTVLLNLLGHEARVRVDSGFIVAAA